jgi:predicted SprT family Zn-dependent metalloprotease
VTELASMLRQHQESHPTLGDLFRALHTFADRTAKRYFDDVEMPPVAISLDKDRRTKLGHYRPRDGYLQEHAINLNVHAHRTAADLVQTLAHELVHLWQVVDGHPCVNNHHGSDFHTRIATMGIETSGPRGMHRSTSAEWANWLEENADLELERYVLPGVEAKARRQLNLFHCQCEGGNPIRSRRWLDVTCNECGEDYEYVPTSARRRSGGSRG